MAATKAKRSTSKLKASKKKTLNKWIIVGGVAAVAIAGALIVRFSGASGQYINKKHITGRWTLTTNQQSFGGAAYLTSTRWQYRNCFRGYSTGANSVVEVSAAAYVVKATYNVGRTSKLYCSYDYPGTGYVVTPSFRKVSGPNIIITAVGLDEKLGTL